MAALLSFFIRGMNISCIFVRIYERVSFERMSLLIKSIKYYV